jgi:hypothetical protein
MPVGAAIKKLSDNYLQYKHVEFVFSDKARVGLIRGGREKYAEALRLL